MGTKKTQNDPLAKPGPPHLPWRIRKRGMVFSEITDARGAVLNVWADRAQSIVDAANATLKKKGKKRDK